MVMAFVVFGFQVHGSSERAILWSARHGLRSQLHKFDDFVAVGATANDVKDLLSEVEGLRHELKESIDSFSNGALFWGGVVLLVLGTRRTTDKQ